VDYGGENTRQPKLCSGEEAEPVGGPVRPTEKNGDHGFPASLEPASKGGGVLGGRGQTMPREKGGKERRGGKQKEGENVAGTWYIET